MSNSVREDVRYVLGLSRRFGWIVALMACGAITGRTLAVAQDYIHFGTASGKSYLAESRLIGPGVTHYTFVGALVGVVAGMAVQLAVRRFRFGIDLFIELAIVCAFLMFLWQMYSAAQAKFEEELLQQRLTDYDLLIRHGFRGRESLLRQRLAQMLASNANKDFRPASDPLDFRGQSRANVGDHGCGFAERSV